MRPLWSGSIAFGLVNIPVKLYSATYDHTISLDMLHKADLSPIRYARVCKADGKEIEWKDIVKGYKLDNGEYVVITEADFKAASSAKSATINIEEFVQEKEIDPVFFEKPYYLAPDKGAGHAYDLLRQALEKSKKVGIAKFVFHNREHLITLKPHQNILMINQLRFAEEIRAIEDLEVAVKEKSSGREIEMAVALIDQLTQKFKPEQYKDNYNDQLRDLIDKKAKGQAPKGAAKHAAKPTKVVDLFDTLKASLKPKTPKRRKSA
ncbi:MAG: Ku protein [Chlamydiales bacterium]|nr:Ku protein [Chlamydiales bacterium]